MQRNTIFVIYSLYMLLYLSLSPCLSLTLFGTAINQSSEKDKRHSELFNRRSCNKTRNPIANIQALTHREARTLYSTHLHRAVSIQKSVELQMAKLKSLNRTIFARRRRIEEGLSQRGRWRASFSTTACSQSGPRARSTSLPLLLGVSFCSSYSLSRSP